MTAYFDASTLGRSWLLTLPEALRSIVGGLFGAAIADGCDTPAEVCRHAAQSVRLRIEDTDDDRHRALLGRVATVLERETAGMFAYAESRIAWAKLPESEREAQRAQSAAEFRAGGLERYKQRLAAWAAERGGR